MKSGLLIIVLFFFNESYSQYRATLAATAPVSLNNKKISLVVEDNYSLHRYRYMDSAIIQNGSFVISGITIHKPCETASIFIRGDKHALFQFVIDSGVNKMEIRDVSEDSELHQNKLSNTVLLNSRSNQLNQQLKAVANKFFRLYGKKVKGYPGITVLDLDTENDLYKQDLNILARYPDEYYSLVDLYILSHTRLTPEDILRTFETLSNRLQSSALGGELYKATTENISEINATKIGSPVPEFHVETAKNRLLYNKDLQGQPYIIAFSATWCIPCKENEPKLLALYNKYRGKGLEVLYFNLDDDTVKWKHYITAGNMDWINVSERTKWADSKISKQFYVEGIPRYFLVNKEGKIAYVTQEVNSDLEKNILKVIR